MSNNPILNSFLSTFGGGPVSYNEFTSFMQGVVSNSGFYEVPGSTATALYSGKIGEMSTADIAKDMAARSGGKIRIIDNTQMGQFLGAIFGDGNPGKLTFQPEDLLNYGDSAFNYS